jgi:hypothetical protein
VTHPVSVQNSQIQHPAAAGFFTRLWQIADMDPEMTRNSASSQVKAISMIIAIEGLIPPRTTVAAENQPASPPVDPPFYVSAWARTRQNGETANSEPSPDPAEQEALTEVQSAPGRAIDPPPTETTTVLAAAAELQERETGCLCPKTPKNTEFYRILQKGDPRSLRGR